MGRHSMRDCTVLYGAQDRRAANVTSNLATADASIVLWSAYNPCLVVNGFQYLLDLLHDLFFFGFVWVFLLSQSF